MKSFFFVLAQLTLVMAVYAFAYRTGYRNAQSKAMPVTTLFDQLNESIDKKTEDEKEQKKN